ncbi:hypothetical protein [Nocardioides convexus]|uniref:hypothetical protein n=1 Tax=Nocardioides convexus TaxID=2712224 RepID=UPI0024188ED3|nr:hypothetical protein [Nocardioides convexus]
MNDEYDGEPTEPIAQARTPEPASQWAPPGPGAERLPVSEPERAAAPDAAPEPTAVLPSEALMAPSLLPPPPATPPSAADLSVRRPTGAGRGPAWRWPLVALVALVVGLGGGLLGALGYDKARSTTTRRGRGTPTPGSPAST